MNKELKLSNEFVEQYKTKDPKFGFNGLGYIVYKRTYARQIEGEDRTEEWYETVRRCVEGAQAIGAGYTEKEMEKLFDYVFHLKGNFAGRMLWQFGTETVERYGGASLLNCWYTSMREYTDFGFVFDNLMLGGGMGFSVRREDIHELPKVNKGVSIVHEKTKDADFIVPDSREGWVSLLQKIMDAYLNGGKSFTYSTILIRGAGEPITGFGGTASGPQILIDGMKEITDLMDLKAGKKLKSTDVLDIVNILGSVVVAGNVRRCLPKDSLVHTKRGLVRIQEVTLDDYVLTSDGYENITNIFDQGEQETMVLKTENGDFECTPNHKMAVMTGINKYNWKEARKLSTDDLLVNVNDYLSSGIKTSLPTWNYTPPKHSTTCQSITVPELDNEMAWFIGLLQGDGYVYTNRKNNGFNAYVSVACSNDRPEILERSITQLKRFETNVWIKEPTEGDNCYKVGTTSKQLAWYLEHMKKPKTTLCVPTYILQGTDEIKLSFVSGLCDADGSDKTRPFIVCSTIYKEYADEIQTVLKSVGILTSLTHKIRKEENWNDIYDITIKNNSSKELFNKSIGYKKCHIGKELGSTKIPAKYFDGEKDLTLDVYNRNDKHKTLSLLPVKINSIEQGRTVETFDLEVKNKHEFVCNGLLTHNSAEIAIGDSDDIKYIKAKRWDLGNIPNHRAMSNNSIDIDEFNEDVPNQIWAGYKGNGEPYGFVNMRLSKKFGRLSDGPMSKSDLYPTNEDNAEGFNPCAEITLGDGEACNLCELYLNRLETKEEAIELAKLLYKTQKSIWNLDFAWEKTRKIVQKNRRIGLGITGVCQSMDKLDWLDDIYRELRAFDVEWSKKMDVPRSIKLTTVKPSGTLSLLAGATPGVHPAYSQFYIRRVRMSSTDKLVETCRKAGLHIEYALGFDGKEERGTQIVSFPCTAGDDAKLAKDMTAIEQLELVKRLQSDWADNAVSVTVYYRPEELKGIQQWLVDNYKTSCKSVSFLLHNEHGFHQSPYEEISKEEYDKMLLKVDTEFYGKITTSEAIESMECDSGACPIK